MIRKPGTMTWMIPMSLGLVLSGCRPEGSSEQPADGDGTGQRGLEVKSGSTGGGKRVAERDSATGSASGMDTAPIPGSAANQGLAVTDTKFVLYRAPAGTRPTTLSTRIDGYNAAILPNGRLVTPLGQEVAVGSPKPFGLAVAPNDSVLATVNSGEQPFSITLIRGLDSVPTASKPIQVNAAFMGVVFLADNAHFYVSGGENGNLWVGEVASGAIVGSVNLNGPAHPLERPLGTHASPEEHFSGAFPGAMALSPDGRYLYVVDQAGFQVHVVDTTRVLMGVDSRGDIVEPDNFAAVVSAVPVGRYPFGLTLAPDGRTLFVANVGVFQYSHLTPPAATGDHNHDYPLCIPGVGYPDETRDDRLIWIKKIDASTISGLPLTLRDPDGIRCGYVYADQQFTVPGLGDPNVAESSSVYVIDVSSPAQPRVLKKVKTGRLIGEVRDGIETYGASHPNAVAAGTSAIYVANGNNDSISILDPVSYAVVNEIDLSCLSGDDRRLKGVQPVSLALSPDQKRLYVAEAGINAVGVLSLSGTTATVLGHLPVGWWPSSVRVSHDGSKLYVANAKGRGAGPHTVTAPLKGSAFNGVAGTVNIIDVPASSDLSAYTARMLANNGFVAGTPPTDTTNPIPTVAGAASAQIKHVIFINKENAPYDLLLGDITSTRQGVAVNGRPSYAWAGDAAPNHHELALSFALSDNFFLEPAVSSDGHRWLTMSYTTEFEETHWPASYGGGRESAGDDPAVYQSYPGRLGFGGSAGTPEPHDYNQHGGIYKHLVRNGLSFVNFGNGFDMAGVDYADRTEPTGVRMHVNVPMEKVVRDNTDHLYAEWNLSIPDSPLPENPDRFNRFGRFKQVFLNQYAANGTCTLPSYVDLYYPNDHGGGGDAINGAGGEKWDFKRYVQDNDAALGLTIDLISHSPCWKDTVIFVSEDDTQSGLDHVDGYRAPLLVIGPWVKREYVSKTHSSMASIFKTIDLILGMPPLNLYDAAATDLRDFFTGTPNYAPYTYIQPVFAKKADPRWAALTKGIDFSEPDSDEVDLRAAIEGTVGRAMKAKGTRAARRR